MMNSWSVIVGTFLLFMACFCCKWYAAFIIIYGTERLRMSNAQWGLTISMIHFTEGKISEGQTFISHIPMWFTKCIFLFQRLSSFFTHLCVPICNSGFVTLSLQCFHYFYLCPFRAACFALSSFHFNLHVYFFVLVFLPFLSLCLAVFFSCSVVCLNPKMYICMALKVENVHFVDGTSNSCEYIKI